MPNDLMTSPDYSAPTFVPVRAWWKEAVVYQILPTSFFDSDGDGIGDLNGIHAKLDYLLDLGVDVLWLCPIHPSPMADMGYDISDYRGIDPRYGTMADFDDLVQGLHRMDMKIMMDLVINHTSDKHDWFLQSRSSKSNPKRDWYIWRPPRSDCAGNRRPPNNWRSPFQGSVWEYDENTDEYYFHTFASNQPDLNWDNSEVREAIWDVMRFWVDKGCDGFRLDVINLLSKADGLPDAPITVPEDEFQPAGMYFANGPNVHKYVKEMHTKLLSTKDLVTVGEVTFYPEADDVASYVLPANKELSMAFQHELMDRIDAPNDDNGQDIVLLKVKQWSLDEFRDITTRWQRFKREEGFWNSVFIENHDHPRSVSRFGNDSNTWRSLSAKMLATLQITQSGTQFIFQGQELALKNLPKSFGIEEYKDIASLNYWNSVLARRRQESGSEDVDMSDILDDLQRKARDHARGPMQWNSTSNAGFTTGVPWMRVDSDFEQWNVAAQLDDESSVHTFWRRALGVRKQYEVLIYGDFTDLSQGHPSVFAYVRSLHDMKALVLLNFKDEFTEFYIHDLPMLNIFTLILGNYEAEGHILKESEAVRLQGYESRLYIAM